MTGTMYGFVDYRSPGRASESCGGNNPNRRGSDEVRLPKTSAQPEQQYEKRHL